MEPGPLQALALGGSAHRARNREERWLAVAVDENKRFILALPDGTGVFVLRLDFNQVV